MHGTGATRSGGSVALSQEFVALAVRFGMVPARLAERVLASFVRERPRELLLTAVAGRASVVRR